MVAAGHIQSCQRQLLSKGVNMDVLEHRIHFDVKLVHFDVKMD